MAQIVMIASGKGGTGKSTVAAFLSQSLARSGYRTFLTELDMGLRSIDVISGISDKAVYDIGDVLQGGCSAEKALIQSPHCPKLHIMAAPGKKSGVSYENLKQFVDKIYNDYDYIIIDTAAGLGEAFNAAVKVAGLAVIVATPDAVSVRDARIVSDEIYNGGINDIRLVINKYDKNTFKHSGFSDGDAIIDACCARLLGVIPYDTAIQLSSMNGTVLPYESISNKIFAAMGERLCGKHPNLYIK